MAQKQNFETNLTKQVLRSLAGLKPVLDDAESAAAMKTIQTKLLVKHDAMVEGVRKAVVPVKHSLKVVAEQ
ncbi:MAG: hypothetical protein NTW87_16330 [Planctomycetota bacterium]|nr:hypothetical protein [Planctomycetota bacterium]